MTLQRSRLVVGSFVLLPLLIICGGCSKTPTGPSSFDPGKPATLDSSHISTSATSAGVNSANLGDSQRDPFSPEPLSTSHGTPNSLTATVVTIEATSPTAKEAGPVPGVFTVSRTGESTAALTVNYKVGGTAKAGSDYAALAGGVVISAGQSSAVITVTPVDDTDKESPETVIVTLGSGVSYTVASYGTATVTIVDNDALVKCRCKTISYQFEPGGAQPKWGAYLVHGNSVWRVGFRIDVKCTGEGNSSLCKIIQNEKGKLTWTVDGKSGEIVGKENKVSSFHKGKAGEQWEKEYSDALGADYPVNTTGEMSVNLEMEFEIKCVSSDGEPVTKRFKVKGSVKAKATVKGGKPDLTGANLQLAPLN